MLYREIIAVCSQIHTKHTNTLCGQKAEFLNDTAPGTHSYRWALKGLRGDDSSQEKGPSKPLFGITTDNGLVMVNRFVLHSVLGNNTLA